MRTWIRYFLVLGAFEAAIGVLYWFWTSEPAGTVLFLSIGLMPLLVAGYALWRGYLAEPQPQDDPRAEPADSEGVEIGSFPAATGWPLFLTFGVILVGASLVYGLVLLPLGLALMAWAVVGLARESGS